ncbi:hypothetical protein Tco_0519122 [Tanacetum coccineum]
MQKDRCGILLCCGLAVGGESDEVLVGNGIIVGGSVWSGELWGIELWERMGIFGRVGKWSSLELDGVKGVEYCDGNLFRSKADSENVI